MSEFPETAGVQSVTDVIREIDGVQVQKTKKTEYTKKSRRDGEGRRKKGGRKEEEVLRVRG